MTDSIFLSVATLFYLLSIGIILIVLAVSRKLELGGIKRHNWQTIGLIIIIVATIGLLSGGKVEVSTGIPSYLTISILIIMLIIGLTAKYYLDQWKKDSVSSLEPNHVGNTSNDINEPTSQMKSFSILFLAADPTNTSRLRLGEELREIQEKLQLAKHRDKFDLQQRMSVRPTDVSQALLDVQPFIVHFSGHGMSSGELCFENQVGEVHSVEPDALAELFEQFSQYIKCVLLNACYSEAQAQAIAKHIAYVIGMNKEIGDRAAIAFSIGFYQALGAGRNIEEAYNLGCTHIKLYGISEQLTPVIIKKS